MLNKLISLFRIWPSQRPDDASHVAEEFQSIVHRELLQAMAHESDSYWMHDGYNVGQEECRATSIASDAHYTPKYGESPAQYATTTLSRLRDLESRYRIDYVDPDGYGGAIFSSIERTFRDYLKAAGISVPDRKKSVM
jgi:hypothetical protein